MKLKLLQLLISLLYKETPDDKITQRQRMIAYKDAYQIENLDTILRSKIRRAIYQIALKGKDNDEMWFNRGEIHAYQSLIQQMKKNHDLFIKEKENEAVKDKKGHERIQRGYSA